MIPASNDAVFIAANILQSGRIGSTFEWALQEAIDNMEQFASYTPPALLAELSEEQVTA